MPPDAPIRLTACVIAKDEERDLPDCLASVAFCDEIVVVDSGSTDRTRELAEAAGARVVEQEWLGFAAQRNVALDHARGEWVLEIDADERVTPALRAEIAAFVAEPPEGVALAGLPRREVLVGTPFGGSAKFPNYCHRLLRRGSHRHDEARTVHEGLIPDGPVHPFAGELEHLYAPTWGDALDDARSYARLEAEQMSAPRSAAAVMKGVVLRPAAKLVYRLGVDGGWRDGGRGVARIGLDCATDALVWLRYAVRGPTGGGRSGVAAGEHYGSRRFPRGSAHVAALAIGPGAVRRARAWTAAAAAGGLDAVLLAPGGRPRAGGAAASATLGGPSDRTGAAAVAAQGGPSDRAGGAAASATLGGLIGRTGAAAVRHRVLAGRGPIAAIRALDAEEQLRTLDAVVPFGRAARAWARATPGVLRGIVPPPAEGIAPDELAARIAAAREELAA